MATTNRTRRTAQKKSQSAEVNEQNVKALEEKKEEEARLSTVRSQQEEVASNDIIDASGSKTPYKAPEDQVVVVDDGQGKPVSDEELFEAAQNGDENALQRLKNRLSQARQEAGNNRLQGGVQVVDDGTAVIRMAHTLENFTYGPTTFPILKQGQRYRLPREIANYLDMLGYAWH